jgi:hypothetical protein
MKPVTDFWAGIKDFGASHAILVLAIVAFLGVYFLLQRFASGPASSRLFATSVIIAGMLIVVAIIGAFIASFGRQDEDDGNWTRISGAILDMGGVHFVLLAALLVLIGVLLFYCTEPSDAPNLLSALRARFLPASNGTGSTYLATRNLAFFVGAMLLILVAVVSATRYLYDGVFRQEYSSIAPFAIAGSDDKGRGAALASALQAKLVDIQRDIQVLEKFRKRVSPEDDSPDDSHAPARARGADYPVHSPVALLDVLSKANLDFKFQGVDVGGIFNWLWNWLAMRNAMQISVAEQGDRAVISGLLRPDGSSLVFADVEKAKDERIVAAVAYSILRDRLVAEQEEYKSLAWDDMETLFNSTLAVGNLNARSEVKRDDFKPYLVKVSDLIVKAPRLEGLLDFGAGVAMRAGEIDKAIAFIDRANASLAELRTNLDHARSDMNVAIEEEKAQKLEAQKADAQKADAAVKPKAKDADDEDDADDKETYTDETEKLIARFNGLRDDFVRRLNSQMLQRQRVLSNCALPFVERLRSGDPPATVLGEALAAHKALLRIAPTQPSYTPVVAIVGGVPQRETVHYPFDVKGTWIVGRPAYDNFADTLGAIVVSLAPRAKLLFIPLGTDSLVRGGFALFPNENEIGTAVQTAIDNGADIVIVPFSFNRKARVDSIKAQAGRALIVTAAPTARYQTRMKTDIATLPAAFIADADVDGRFKLGLLASDETPVGYPGAIWAPGTRIPKLAPDGMWQAGWGSGYATAVAGSVFANILGVTGKARPDELLALVRKSLQHPDPRNPENGVIDQTAALGGAARPGSTTSPGKACGS